MTFRFPLRTTLSSLVFMCGSALLCQAADTAWFRARLLPLNGAEAVGLPSSADVKVHVVRDGSGKVIRGYVDFHLEGFSRGTTISDLSIGRGSGDTATVIAVAARHLPKDLKDRIRLRRSAPVFADDPASLALLEALMEGSAPFYVNLTTSSAAMRGRAMPSAQASLETGASEDGAWKEVDETTLGLKKLTDAAMPRFYRTFQLDSKAFASLLGRAPMESTGTARTGAVTIGIPMPDGQFSRFRIEESPVMEPALAAKFPDFKTYRGQGIDDPAATARFDWTSGGFHAVVLFPDETVYVNPAAQGDSEHYVSYYQQDRPAVQIQRHGPGSDIVPNPFAGPSRPVTPSPAVGATLRTYKLAIGVTKGFTASTFYGGGGDGVAARNATLTKLGQIVNLMNALYERDLAIHFNLIAAELSIIFDTTSNPDPGYTDGNDSLMLTQNQGFLDTKVGNANYDIGHAFGLTGTVGSAQGLATVGVVCGTPNKAKAVTLMGIGLVTGDFVIDTQIVDHEVAHQFNAEHTTNSTSGFCAVERNAATAYEVGSGSTILANASSCAPENLQQNTDNYFHGNTLDEMNAYAAGAGACFASSATGNTVPTVTAGANMTIPMGTPFTLTATANDTDGDTLTLNWEEFDIGTASPPLTDDGTRPLFRSVAPNSSLSRTFPSLTYILNNANQPPATIPCPDDNTQTCIPGETVPVTSRTMNFRVTVRDNRAGGGGVANSSLQVTSSTAAGPFKVTQPNTAITWPALSTQTVTWAVAGTSAAPVNTANVKISLSTDGGNTFPTVLLASTANNGSAMVSIPNTPSTTARIKVEAVGNIFFDISDVNFTIGAAATPPTADSVTGIAPGSLTQTLTFKYSSVSGFAFLTDLHALFNSSITPTGGCWIDYNQQQNKFFLLSDGVTAAQSFTAGTNVSINNGQCTLNGAGSTVSGSVNTLTVVLNVVFSASFGGSHAIYMYAADQSGQASGWQQKGSTAGSPNTPPTADSITGISAGSLTQNALILKYSSANGAAYLMDTYVLFNSSLSGTNGCFAFYDKNANGFYLVNDAGTALSGPLAQNAATTISNSQCTLNGTGSSVSLLGNTLTMNLNVVFTAGFGAAQTVFMYAADAGGLNSGWQQRGTTGGATPPTADSVTGMANGTASQTLVFKYSSANGFGSLSDVHALLNSSLNGTNACWVFYHKAVNGFYLLNDTSSAFLGPLTPGSASTLSNTQCTLNGTGSTVSGSANTLTMTLNLNITGLHGAQGIFMYASDAGGLASGWQNNGAVTLP